MDEHYLKKLHGEILQIMDCIVDICNRYHLRYFLTGGTLLGAIRHKGFIPWDDDFDIIMPREDFEKFVSLCTAELPEGYSLKWITTEKDYYRLFAKVCNDNTLFSEILYPGHYSNYGIFVDIFPLDGSFGYSKKLEMRKKLIKKIEVMINLNLKEEKRGIKSRFSGLFSIPQLQRFATKLMSKDSFKMNADYYSNFGSQYPIKRWTLSKSLFEQTVLVPFEDREYIAPKEYDSVLNSVFGRNYMEIPPVEKQKSHYPHEVVFSDGERILFDEPIHRLSIKDTF